MKIKEIVSALNEITGGRVVADLSDITLGKNPFVVMKSSNIPGKEVIEIPGLVFGDPEKEVKKVAITMTLTEQSIELAGATGVDLIVAHHPVADAANSGGVTLKNYLGLYGISVIELHEAFHGLHPGISYIHGHRAYKVDISYGGIPGNIMYVGKVLEGINTLKDIIERINSFMDIKREFLSLENEKSVYGEKDMVNSATGALAEVFLGEPDSKVEYILHIFPHTGFEPVHLLKAKSEYPEIDTVICSISRVKRESPLVKKAEELGLNFICGNSHAYEIFENGLPLALALKSYVKDDIEIRIFREKVYSFPVSSFGSDRIKEYADYISQNYLIKNPCGR
ncbi:Nif3-like dinuclear metal center hexameric protein [Thermovenabulum sp.]|uniref:Nif3-like dinuclear metal center hexameric protein n=1 Tax=Thermovenabulum sp. TaxID=3100335 RepID=UPI003C7EB63D